MLSDNSKIENIDEMDCILYCAFTKQFSKKAWTENVLLFVCDERNKISKPGKIVNYIRERKGFDND